MSVAPMLLGRLAKPIPEYAGLDLLATAVLATIPEARCSGLDKRSDLGQA